MLNLVLECTVEVAEQVEAPQPGTGIKTLFDDDSVVSKFLSEQE